MWSPYLHNSASWLHQCLFYLPMCQYTIVLFCSCLHSLDFQALNTFTHAFWRRQDYGLQAYEYIVFYMKVLIPILVSAVEVEPGLHLCGCAFTHHSLSSSIQAIPPRYPFPAFIVFYFSFLQPLDKPLSQFCSLPSWHIIFCSMEVMPFPWLSSSELTLTISCWEGFLFYYTYNYWHSSRLGIKFTFLDTNSVCPKERV